MTTFNSKIAKAGLGLIAAASMLIGASAMAYTFTASLHVGSTGPDVMALQQVLNASSTPLQVAAGAAGSPGHESSYYGNATAAAVTAFQAAHGISPTTGTVGPLTRGVLNSMGSMTSTVPGCTAGAMYSSTTGAPCSGGSMSSTLPAGCTSTSGFSTTTGMSCAGSSTGTQTGSLTASLSTDNPAAGYIIGGQATADLAHFTFTGSGTLNSVTLTRTGISDQNTLSNVYLYNGTTRLTDGYSFNNNSTITMNNLGIVVNGSMEISVKADVATNQPATSLGVSLTSFTNGTTVNNVNIAGNQMSYGTGSLATANIPSSGMATSFSPSSGATVNAGTTQYDVWQSTLSVGTRAIALKGMNLRLVGSAPASSLANVNLYIDGVQAGSSATMGSIGGTSYAMFNFASPVSLSTGSHTVEVRADIQGGASYTVQASLQQAADLVLFDPQVGVNIAATTGTSGSFSSDNAYTITINGGSAAIVIDPTFQSLTNITGGATQTDIAKFQIHGYGEDVKVQTLTVQPVWAGTPTLATGSCAIGGATYCTLNNVTLFFNGMQVGSQMQWDGHSALSFNLGSQMIVPAGVNSTVEVKADLQNASDVNYTGGSISANLVTGSSNAQGQSSHTTLNFPTGTVVGNVLNVETGQLSVSKNTAYNNQTLNPNLSGQKLGSFTLQNLSSSESVRITGLTVALAFATPTYTSGTLTAGSQTITVSSTAGFSVGNVIQIGTAVGTVTAVSAPSTLTVNITTAGAATGGTAITGSGTTTLATITDINNLRTSETSGSGATPIQPSSSNTFSTNFTLMPGATETIDVLGDLSAANMGTVQVTLTPTAIGASSNVAITTSPVAGQTISLGAGTFNAPTFTTSSSTTGQFVTGGTTTGATDVTKATFNFTATNGAATINQIKFAVAGVGATSVKVAGLSAPVSNGLAYLTGLSIAVPNGGAGTYVDVYTSYSPVGSTGVPSGSLSAVAVKSVQYTLGGVTTTSSTGMEDTGATYTSAGTFTGGAGSSTGSFVVSSSTGYNVGDVVFFGAPGTSNVLNGVVSAVADSTHITVTIEATGAAPVGGSTIYHYTKSAPTMYLVGSKPIITVATTSNSGLVIGENHLMDVTVAADAGGNINLNQIVFTVSTSGGVTGVSAPRIANGTTTITGSSCSGTTTVTCTFTGGYSLQANTPITLSLYETVAASSGLGAAGTSSVTVSLAAASNLSWTDVAGGGSAITTANTTYFYNYPTQTWSIHN